MLSEDTENTRQDAQQDTEQILSVLRDRSGHIIRRHKESAQHQAAAGQMCRDIGRIQSVPAENTDKGHKTYYVAARNPQVDDPHQDQNAGAGHNGDHGSLSDRPGRPADHHIQNIDTLPGFEIRQRRSAGIGDTVKIGHNRSKGDQQEASAAQRRVHEILPQTAEQHLHHQNGEHTAHHADPPGRGRRKVQCQQQSRHHRRVISYRYFSLTYLFKKQFCQHRGRHSDQNQDQCIQSEIVNAESRRRKKCDHHCQHNTARIGPGSDMRIG